MNQVDNNSPVELERGNTTPVPTLTSADKREFLH